MLRQKVLIVLNGQFKLNKKELKKIINNEDIKKIIAVDGGAEVLKKMSLIPDLIIGDLDSISEKTLNFFKDKNVEINKYPSEKDETDSELAINYCKNNNLGDLIITAALGGRIDQELANINLLEYIKTKNLNAKIVDENIEISIIEKNKKFIDKKDYRLSLIPQTSVVKNTSISGCKYNLDNKSLYRHKTRGISNLITEKEAVVTIEKGLLIYILEKIKE
jgi:thiamine pyrophosphokinase